MLRLEARKTRSALMLWLTPIFAMAATMLAGAALFAALGVDPGEALRLIFIEPLTQPFNRAELLVKAAPLALIAIGLSIGFRAGVWNIGAEGQFIVGAIAGGATALAFWGVEGIWLGPLMALAGAAAGCAWAMIPAILKIRFGANEILVSLMLVYVADLLLSVLVSGPLRDPDGFNFPQSRLFHDSATLPLLIEGARAHIGALVALGAVVAAYVFMARHSAGFDMRLFGEAPRAAAFSGVRRASVIAGCLGVSGALAGLAGVFEAAGPVGQLVPGLPAGYGFTAIIVAFLGRLNPVGMLAASLLMALTYIGGETAQLMLNLPAATTDVFRGMLLCFLLGADILVGYRLRWVRRGTA